LYQSLEEWKFTGCEDTYMHSNYKYHCIYPINKICENKATYGNICNIHKKPTDALIYNALTIPKELVELCIDYFYDRSITKQYYSDDDYLYTESSDNEYDK